MRPIVAPFQRETSAENSAPALAWQRSTALRRNHLRSKKRQEHPAVRRSYPAEPPARQTLSVVAQHDEIERMATSDELLEVGHLIAWSDDLALPVETVQIARQELDRLWHIERRHGEMTALLRVLLEPGAEISRRRAAIALRQLLDQGNL